MEKGPIQCEKLHFNPQLRSYVEHSIRELYPARSHINLAFPKPQKAEVKMPHGLQNTASYLISVQFRCLKRSIIRIMDLEEYIYI